MHLSAQKCLDIHYSFSLVILSSCSEVAIALSEHLPVLGASAERGADLRRCGMLLAPKV